MAQIPFVGPSYQLDSRPASVQRTINLIPYPQEPGNERTKWVFKDVPGLVATGSELSAPTLAISGESKESVDLETFTATVTRFGATAGSSSATWTATGDIYSGGEGFEGPSGATTGTVSFSPGETTTTIVFVLHVGAGTSFSLTVTITDPVNASISIDAADLVGTAGAPPATDPYFAGVVLLIHPGATIIDKSSYAHTLTISSTTVSTANPGPSNSASMLNSDNVAGVVTAAASSAFARAASEPFTMEWSVRIPASYSPLSNTLFMAWDSGRYHSISLPGGTPLITYTDGSGGGYGALTEATWYQLCVSYDGTTRRLFIDGVSVDATGLSSAAITGTPKFGIFHIPDRADLNSFAGEIAEVRLTIGVARYTSDYTPATTPFPDS